MKFLSQINVNTEYTLPIVDGTNGQVLATDGNGNAYWGSISAGATNLDALTDVILTSPTSGQLLRYGIPPGSGETQPVWYNWSPNYLTPSSSIDNLGDVTITSATAGQILQWNGSAWVNATLSTVEYVSKVQHLVKAGVAITKGQAVYVTSADGTNMIVGLASNASEATSSKVIGLAASNASINGQIFVVTEGLLAGLNTSTATAGDPVWLGTNGNLIFGLLNKPASPAHLVYIGVVTRAQQNNGEIFVNVQNGIEIDEIHDVQISSPSTGQLLRRDSDGFWKNWSPNFLTAEADTLATVTARGATTTSNITVNGAAFATSFSATGLLIANADTSGSLQPDQGSPANKIYSFRWAGNEQGYIDTDAKITFAGFKTPTGTASQFLKANGTVDSSVYITSAALSGYATQAWVNSNFYNQSQIDDFFGGAEPISGYNKSNWDAAYNDKVNSASFNTTNGVLTLTQQDGGTVTVDLDGRYVTSATDSQSLIWDVGSKSLSITNGNTVTLDGLATEDFVTSQGYITGYTESDTLATVTGRGASTSTTLNLNGRVNIGNGLARPNALTSDSVAHARIGGADVHLYVASLEAAGGYRVAVQAARTSDFASFGLDLQSNGGTLLYGGNEIATRAWVQAQGYITGYTETDTLATVTARGATTNGNIVINGEATIQNSGYLRLIAGSSEMSGFTVFNSAQNGYLSNRITTSAHSRGWGWEFTTNEANNNAGNVYFRVGYNGAVSYLNSGNFGIGTTAPQQKLDVDGNISLGSWTKPGSTYVGLRRADDGSFGGGGDSGLVIESYNHASPYTGDYSQRVHLRTHLYNGGSHNVLTAYGFNVGIGTTTPTYKLHVAGNAYINETLYVNQQVTVEDNLLVTTGIATVSKDLGTNDYANTGQHNMHLRLRKASLDGGCAPRALELGVLDNGTGIIQANHCGVGYNTLSLNPVAGSVLINGNTAWHAGNDGSGSGLDADLIDGIDSSSILWGNAKGTNDSITTDADGLDKTGFYTSSAFVTRPESVDNWMYIQHIKLYNNNPQYQKQIGYDTYDDRMWVRTKNANSWTSWKEIVTSDNIGSYALTSLPAHTHTIANVTGLQTALDGKLSTSGKAADSDAVDGIDSSRIVFGDGARASTNSGNMDDPNQKSGFHFAYNPTGRPYEEWWNWITIAGNSWQSSNNYSFQLAHDFHGDRFYVRRMTNGTPYSWREVITSGNIGTYALTSLPSHNHDDRYYTESESDSRFVNTAGDTMTGDLILKYSTANSSDYNGLMFAPYSDADGLNDYIIKAASDRGVFGRKSFGWHVHSQSAFGVYSNGWVQLFGVEGGTGNTQVFGNLTVSGSITESSSIRYKKDVVDIESASAKVEQLKPVRYKKIKDDQEEIGLIAEDVAELFPEVVKYDNEGRPDGVNYSRLSVILLKAVQELSQEVNELKKKLN